MLTVLLPLVLISFLLVSAACGGSKTTPPANTAAPLPPTRTDPSLPPISDMQAEWAREQLPHFGIEIADGPSKLSGQEAIRRGKVWFASPNSNKAAGDAGSIQALLVRYTADPKYSKYGRLSWFLVAPPVMRLERHGPAPVTIPDRDTPQGYWWAPDNSVLMDDETGEFWGGSQGTVGRGGPQLSANQLDVVQRYAESYGWWPVWYRLKAYSGQPVPTSVIDAMRF
jgi:hypothetical protein